MMVSGGDKNIAEDLVLYCMERLSYFKVPGYVIFLESLPVTSTQKVQRAQLHKLSIELSSTSDCVDCRHLKKKN